MISLRWTILVALVVACGGVPPHATTRPKPFAKARPNVLFILTDDQAPWALGVSGNPEARTPNLDRLFREGAYLQNAFTVTPVCSPSRAALMTSRYGSEVGITDWINPDVEPDLGLNPAIVTWPEALADAGYATGLVGKWHLGDQDRFHPTTSGYRHFMGFRGGGTTPRNPSLEAEGKARKFEGFTSDILTDHAIEFLRKSAERSRQGTPFLLSLHFRSPHAPYLPVSDEDWATVKDLDAKPPRPGHPDLDVPRMKQMMREYLASVSEVDRNVGRLMRTLDDLKLTEITIVVFTSDHGYNMGHHGIWHKGNGHWLVTSPPEATKNIPRGQRPNMFDTSLRVPFAIRWPGVIKPGKEIRETVTFLDWYPTVLDICGVPKPAGVKLRGRSILPLLKGAKVRWNNDLYAEYSTHHQSHTHMRVYRTPEWKLIRDFLNEGRDELYDLKHHPVEAHNLITSTNPNIRRVLAGLDAKILERMRDNHDSVLPLAEARARSAQAPAGPPPGRITDFKSRWEDR